MKYVEPEAWVKLAASTDTTRAVLCAMHVTESVIEATDSHRLHRSVNRRNVAGLWDAKTGAPVQGTYPEIDRLIPAGEPTHTVSDLPELRAVVAAAVAYGKARRYLSTVTFRCQDGDYIALNAGYLADVLRGVGEYESTFTLRATSPLHVARIDLNIGLALLMPVRRPDSTIGSDRFDISECLTDYSVSLAA